MPAEGEWTVRRSIQLEAQLGTRRYRGIRDRIESRIAELLKDPHRAASAERLRYRYAGLRSARMVDATRLIYRICGECRQLGDRHRRPLDCCRDGATADRTVNLLCLSEHYADMPPDFDFGGG